MSINKVITPMTELSEPPSYVKNHVILMLICMLKNIFYVNNYIFLFYCYAGLSIAGQLIVSVSPRFLFILDVCHGLASHIK